MFVGSNYLRVTVDPFFVYLPPDQRLVLACLYFRCSVTCYSHSICVDSLEFTVWFRAVMFDVYFILIVIVKDELIIINNFGVYSKNIYHEKLV